MEGRGREHFKVVSHYSTGGTEENQLHVHQCEDINRNVKNVTNDMSCINIISKSGNVKDTNLGM
jgi:hypothetical protein